MESYVPPEYQELVNLVREKMRQDQMAVVMEQVFDECTQLRNAGQKEYAGEDRDSFENFNKLAADLGIDRKQILWVYAMKHRDGIANFLRGHESQREDVTGRINDLIVYLVLLRGMIDEERAQARREDELPETYLGTEAMSAMKEMAMIKESEGKIK